MDTDPLQGSGNGDDLLDAAAQPLQVVVPVENVPDLKVL